MPKVEMQLGETEYRIVIDGDEDTEFVPYGEPCVVEYDDGTVYWALAMNAIEESPVYSGRECTPVNYQDVEIAGEEGEETTVEVDETEVPEG